MSATKARAIKLDDYTRRENIRLLNVPESQDENCKEILCGVMAAVKMEGANITEFHAVHRIGKQRDDGKPRPIIARFVNRERRNESLVSTKGACQILPSLADMSFWSPDMSLA